jgi:enoyl-CoA hydratase/carnithine racemase
VPSASEVSATGAAAPVGCADRAPGVRWLTLAQPERRNALSSAMIAALQDHLDGASADDAVRVVVLAAEGPVFSSGHDLRELRALSGDDPVETAGAEGPVFSSGHDLRELRALSGDDPAGSASAERCLPVFVDCSRMMATIVRMPKPVIACVQGLATAAGCQLAASCDLVVAAESAAFATPGVDLALFCSTPAVALGRSIGRKAAMEMLLTGERIPARRAYELGLVNRVVPDAELEARTGELASKVAARSPLAVAVGKTAFYRQLEQGLEEAYRQTSEVMARNLLSDDAREGIDAFFEKRPASWRGR